MDWEMSEEDQMLRAIAMSLGENVLVSSNQVGIHTKNIYTVEKFTFLSLLIL